MLWNLAMLFVGLTVVYFVGVFFFRNKISATSKKVRDRKRELSPMISEFLFLEEDATKDEKSNYIALKIEIRQLLKDTFNRQVLSEILLDLRKDVSGDAQQALFRLYQDLGLHKDAFIKLKGWRWQIISKGILDLTRMEVAESYGFITKFINDKRSTIRKQAEIATVTLRHEGINYFLDTTKYKISEWQQLKLLDVIRNKEDFQPPRFKAWLTSSNKYVVLFALRLIKHFNQNDANVSLIELVKHKNSQIKEEAVGCIKEFNVTESLDTLKLVFWNCSIDVKIAILDAIAQIGSDTDIEFLNLIDKKELNFSVKSKALSSINAISPESIMPSKGIQDESRYAIPDDISEAVAKKNAKNHEEISGEKDEEFIVEQITEEVLSAKEKGSHPFEEEDNAMDKVEVETEIEFLDEEIVQDVFLFQEIDTQPTNEKSKNVFEIEVAGEQEIAMEGKNDKKEMDDAEWDDSHLNFIPLIITEEENEIVLEPGETNNYSTPTEELFDIEVVHEVLVPSEETNSSEVEEEDTQSEEIPSFFEEFNIKELTFLPLVVDNNPETQNGEIEEFAKKNDDLSDILVHYDEVQPNLLENMEKEEILKNDLEIDFEPVHELKDIDITKQSESKASLDYKRYDTDEIRNAFVIYKEVLDNAASLELLNIEVIEPYVFLIENKPEQTMDTAHNEEKDNDRIELPMENDQLLQKIIDDLMETDAPQSKEDNIEDDSFVNPDWDLDEDDLDFIPVSFEKGGEETPSYIKIEKTLHSSKDEEINIPRASIPKAIFGDIELEASTRQLLNDLEEMGDQRDIPLLKELLNHEKYDLFKERINNLIDTFNHNRKKENIDNPLQPFSVFQDLFRTCDTEAKLILLNEVVAVGDEKELHFLEGLIKDDSSEIRKKAIKVLKELKIKLFGKDNELKNGEASEIEDAKSIAFFEPTEELSLEPSNDPNDIFDLNFDFSDELNENDNKKKKDDEKSSSIQYGSFFGQICFFTHKILEKING